MESISHNTFSNELHVQSAQHSVLLTEAPLPPNANHEKMMQIQFETFNVISFYVRIQAVPSLYSSGSTTGFVFDAGDGVSHTVLIYQRYSLPHPILPFNLPECDFTAWVFKILNQRRDTFTTSAESEIVHDAQENFISVAFDFQSDLQNGEKTTDCNVRSTLPDQNQIVIANRRFRCLELLFKASFNAFEFDRIDKTLFHSIMESDIDITNDFSANILLSGGTKMFQKLLQPIQTEITKLTPVWIGRSILASLPAIPQMEIIFEENNDAEPEMAHRKALTRLVFVPVYVI
jgi:actin